MMEYILFDILDNQAIARSHIPKFQPNTFCVKMPDATTAERVWEARCDARTAIEEHGGQEIFHAWP